MDESTRDDEGLKAEVQRQLSEAKTFAKGLTKEDAESGQWFLNLLGQVTKSYNRNARASYFQRKYPGLPPDEIADVLISVATRYAAITGGVSGVAATAGVLGAPVSGGASLAIFAGALGAEMLALSALQMRLVLDLAVAYDLELDLDDPEDVLMVFGYAMGVKPAEALGAGVTRAAGTLAGATVRKHVSKETLKAVQRFGHRIGIKILQRSLVKFAVPVASAGAGSAYNYVTTKTLGEIAERHLKNRGKVTDELRAAVSRRQAYDLVVPAAVLFMATSDGTVSPKEMELYKAMLSRMSFDDHEPDDFARLVRDKDSILDAVGRIEDRETAQALIELLTLMAIYDGAIVPAEREWLQCVSDKACVKVDFAEVERRAKDYEVLIRESTASKALDIAGMTAGRAKDCLKTLFAGSQSAGPPSAGIPSTGL